MGNTALSEEGSMLRHSEELTMTFKIPPWKHQLDAIKRATNLAQFALFFEMGTGKTSTAINIARYKCMKHKRLLRTIVLSPPITLENWRREFEMHSNLQAKQTTILYGSGKERLSLFLKKAWDITMEKPAEQVFITNYESLYMENLFAAFQAWGPEFIIFDEAHKCKDMKSSRTKKAIRLADRSTYRLILTGTPVLNSPMDLFAQFRILDRGETFGSNFFSFRNRYFYDKNAGMPSHKHFPDWRILPDSLEKINAEIKRFSARVKKEECLDLPPLIRKRVQVELAPEQRKYYEEMKKNFITYIKGEACTAELALTKALRLQQIASGYLKTEEGNEIKIKKNPRQEALRAILEEICPNHKVLVWACFRENYEQIREVCVQLGLQFVEVHGDTPTSTRQQSVDTFNTDSNIKVFIGHPGSGGIGINLVAASYSIFYSRSFSLEHDLQAESRNHRGGSSIHAKIIRVDIVAENTIDGHIAESLEKKEAISERILRDVSTRL